MGKEKMETSGSASETSEDISPGTKRLECKFCIKTFDNEEALQKHNRRHGKEKHPCCGTYYCEHKLNGVPAPNAPPPKPDTEKLVCPFCSKKFANSAQLSNHLVIHEENDPLYSVEDDGRVPVGSTSRGASRINIRCDSCGAYFFRRSHLVTHIRKEHPELIIFVCKHCSKVFFTQPELEDHEDMHNEKEDERTQKIDRYRCNYCGKVIVGGKCHLKRHIRVHTKEKPFSCQRCGACFGRKDYLDKHKRRHGRPECRFRCTICSERFLTRPLLMEHIKTHYNKIRYKCSYCSKYFVNRKALMRHLSTHSKDRPFPLGGKETILEDKTYGCTDCSKKFSTHYDLVRHIMIGHRRRFTKESFKQIKSEKLSDDEEHFDTCYNDLEPKSFSGHFQEKSDNAMEFTCNYCTVRPKYTSEYLDHIATHVNEGMYSCEQYFVKSDQFVENMHSKNGSLPLYRDCNNNYTLTKNDVIQLAKKFKNLNKMTTNYDNIDNIVMNDTNMNADVNGNEKFSCTYCGRVFSNQYLLLTHTTSNLYCHISFISDIL